MEKTNEATLQARPCPCSDPECNAYVLHPVAFTKSRADEIVKAVNAYDSLVEEVQKLKAKTIWQYDQLRTYVGQVDLREIDIKQLQNENQKLREALELALERHPGDGILITKIESLLKAKNV